MKILLRIGLVCTTTLIWVLAGGIQPGKSDLMARPLIDEKDFSGFTYGVDRENIEFGFEKSFPIQKLSYFSKIEQYYITCASTINRDVTMKFRVGSLTAECENTATGQTIGEFKYTPISVALITSARRPPLKPYLGAGYTIYSYRDFKARDTTFATYKGGRTNGVCLLGGVKYIPNKNISLNLVLTYEMIRPFKFKSKYGAAAISGGDVIFYPEAKLDLSNISVGLNIALRF